MITNQTQLLEALRGGRVLYACDHEQHGYETWWLTNDASQPERVPRRYRAAAPSGLA